MKNAILLLLFFVSYYTRALEPSTQKPVLLIRQVQPLITDVNGCAYKGIQNVKVVDFSCEAKEEDLYLSNLPLLFWVSEKVRDVKNVISSITVVINGDTIAFNQSLVNEGYKICLNLVITDKLMIRKDNVVRGSIYVNINRMDRYIFPSGTSIMVSIDPSVRRPGVFDTNNNLVEVSGVVKTPKIMFTM